MIVRPPRGRLQRRNERLFGQVAYDMMAIAERVNHLPNKTDMVAKIRKMKNDAGKEMVIWKRHDYRRSRMTFFGAVRRSR